MKKDGFLIYAEYYDQIYLGMKDYQDEAMIVRGIIRRFEKKKSKTLLDVGCGTAEHLKRLSSYFLCMGVDVNRRMVEIAQEKVPDAKFKVANMTDLSLGEKFDVIICLFSSIGYVQNFGTLVKTLGNFREHLNDKGLAIVEPWIFRKDYRKGHVGLNTYEDEKLKIARMGTSKIQKSKWLVFLHYLIGEDGKIKHFREVHEMLALDYQDYIRAFRSAGFKNIRFLTEKLWDGCRGLFVAYSNPNS